MYQRQVPKLEIQIIKTKRISPKAQFSMSLPVQVIKTVFGKQLTYNPKKWNVFRIPLQYMRQNVATSLTHQVP